VSIGSQKEKEIELYYFAYIIYLIYVSKIGKNKKQIDV